MEEEGDERQVQVRFTTRLPVELRVASTTFSIPAYLNRYGLSQVINTLLGLEAPRPFDFIVEGELLRTTLEQLYLSKNLSAETVLSIEYIPAVGPPQLNSSQTQDDWVSAVNGTHPSFVLSGCYDSIARLWSDGQCVTTLEGHKDAITSIVVVESKDEELHVVTSSKDKTLRLWEIPTNIKKGKIKPVKVFEGHSASVQCAASNASSGLIGSGSWDSTIKLWKIKADDDDSEEDVTTKKMKVDGAAKAAKLQVTAFTTYKDHSQCVSGLEWPEDKTIYSTSWDHSLRQWDVETGVNTAILTSTKALHCISVGGEARSLVATGGADPVLRLWDPRTPGTVTPVLQLSSHKAWVTSCKWHPSSEKHLLSSSHDGSVKMWDIRSKVPLQTLEGHTDKVLCADWWKHNTVVSGGADKQLKTFDYTLS